MKFSVSLPTDRIDRAAEFVTQTAIAEIARAAEDAGYDACFVTDHPFPPHRWLYGGGHHALDPFVALSFAAAATSRLRLQTHILVLPYRNPFLVAKSVLSLDVLSGGRVILGVAAGYLKGEFAALGADFEARQEVSDEAIRAMKLAWAGDDLSFEGRGFKAIGNSMGFRPVQHPHPPIWVGGNSKAAMRRAVRHDGWYPWLITAADLPEQLEYLRSLPEFETRAAPFDVCMPLVPLAVDEQHRRRADMTGRTTLGRDAQAHVDAVGELAEIGVTWTSVAVPPARSLDEHIDSLRWLADVLGLRRLDDRA